MPTAPAAGNEVRTRHRVPPVPNPEKRKKRKKSALRGRLSLDNWGPHKCSARYGTLDFPRISGELSARGRRSVGGGSRLEAFALLVEHDHVGHLPRAILVQV